MAVVQIDVSDREGLKKTDFPVLEPGIYELSIQQVPPVVPCKGGDKKMVKVEMKYEDAEGEKYTVFDQLVLPYPGCHKLFHARLYQFASCFGVAVDDDGNIDLQEFAGAVGKVRVSQEMYDNKPQNKVKAYLFEGCEEESPQN